MKTQEIEGIKIKCEYEKLIDTAHLIENPKNANKHSKEQVERLAKLLEFQGWRHPIIVSKRSGFIVAGHGRLLAAKHLGIKKVPVDYQDFQTEAEEYAFVVSDNEIARWAELDEEKLMEDLKDLDLGDIDLLGLEEIPKFLDENDTEQTLYTTKVETPIYQITGEKPKITDLYDLEKTNKLLQEIETKNLPEEIKRFLTFAAYRHTIFNYQKIAEFYAHSNKDTQELMENSALVIIDFNKAIENGFVVMTNEIAEAYADE